MSEEDARVMLDDAFAQAVCELDVFVDRVLGWRQAPVLAVVYEPWFVAGVARPWALVEEAGQGRVLVRGRFGWLADAQAGLRRIVAEREASR